MCPHNGTIDAIDEEGVVQVTALVVQALPEVPPDAAAFPASEAVVHRIPAAKLPRQISPGNPGAGNIEDRFDEQPVTQFRRATGLVFKGSESRFNLRPDGVSDKEAYRHRRSPSGVDEAEERRSTP